MGTYIKRPDSVKAFRWTGKNLDEVMSLSKDKEISYDKIQGLTIQTSNGDYPIPIGDMVILDSDEGIYSCPIDVFNDNFFPLRECARLKLRDDDPIGIPLPNNIFRILTGATS